MDHDRDVTEVWLVRHGETDHNATKTVQGQSDVKLNDEGLRQAACVAERLKKESIPFDVIYSSDLSRAAETAKAIASQLNIEVHYDQRLRELNFGEWQNKPLADILGSNTDVLKDPHHKMGGGESYTELQNRVVECISEIAKKHKNKHILVVTHGGAIKSYLCHILQIPLSNVWQITTGNTSITKILPFAVSWVKITGMVKIVNDTSHLHVHHDNSMPGQEHKQTLAI
eukprot:TRINITY_DN6242_c0_g1_i1.p1 TRINITY_DN6242_c0_g1~~TRINITY_DN6242_c0_g1_i1.p1  ORF type:complete len:228 (-),score=6.47 TRINITY_DN6242_c0_g1_i1:39-722(-)